MKGGWVQMKIVVVKSPKILSGILRFFFKIKKDDVQ
ncbi:MAG: stage V sporulation protein SpoVM [Angelakisella sp.]